MTLMMMQLRPSANVGSDDENTSTCSFEWMRFEPNEIPDRVFDTLPRIRDVVGPAGRTTQYVCWPWLAEAVLSQPGFPKRIHVPPMPLHRLTFINESKGMGLTATRFITASQLIFSEHPLLIAQPRLESWVDLDEIFDRLDFVSEEITQDEIMKAARPELEDHFQDILERMDPEDRGTYLVLANSHRHDGSGPLYGVFCTNNIEISTVLDLMPDKPRDEEDRLSAVCENVSRINHRRASSLSFTHIIVRATRDVPEAEELTLQYCDNLPPTVQRQQRLEPYGFPCTCSARMDPLEPDQRRAKIQEFPPTEDGYGLGRWINNPPPDDYIIREA